MEKLTIKELAPYLPYGLKIKTRQGWDTMHTLNGDDGDINEGYEDFYYMSHIKPILRPISDLTKEIEHNGEKFVAIEWLLYNRDVDAEYDFISALEDDWASAEDKIIFAPFSIAQKLFEWKFDIFGLLDKNLAVPVTENFNPYK